MQLLAVEIQSLPGEHCSVPVVNELYMDMEKYFVSDFNKGTNMFPHHRVCGMISFINRNF